jgi:hypothetical protein
MLKRKSPESQPPWKDMSPSEKAVVGRRWRDEGRRHVREFNAFLESLHGPAPDHARELPRDSRSDLAETVLEAVCEANEAGELARLRKRFPPAYHPFLDYLDENGQHVDPLLLLDNGQIVVRASDLKDRTTTYLIDDLHIQTLGGVQ